MRVHDRVERLLKNNPSLRDSDKKLMMAFWKEQGLVFSMTQEKAMYACTPAESITRARRNLRSKYPGNKVVENERFDKFKQYRDDYGSQPRFF